MIAADHEVQSAKMEISARKHVDPIRTSQLIFPQATMPYLFIRALIVAVRAKNCLESNSYSVCQLELRISE